MKYMMLVCVDGASFEAGEEPEDGEDSRSFAWLDDVIARGIRLDGDRLRPPREAKTVEVRDGEVLISDGPFAETKEQIVGYNVIECADLDAAIETAAVPPPGSPPAVGDAVSRTPCISGVRETASPIAGP